MKSLVKYLLEGNVNIFEEINAAVYSWIDYMYNEGVVDYDDAHLVEYTDKKKTPNFNDIVKGVLDEYKSKLSNTTIIVLHNYLKNGAPKDKTSAVENAISAAISKFVDDSNCRNFA